MNIYPAVIVHGLPDAHAVLAIGLPVTLLSSPGAALFAGCLWWRELVAIVRAEHPMTDIVDVLDCADGSGMAMGALRSGVCRLVLSRAAAGWHGVAATAEQQGGFVLPCAPVALDMVRRDATRRLHSWLLNHNRSADNAARHAN